MPQEETIKRFVSIDFDPFHPFFPWAISFYDEKGTKLPDGTIKVSNKGALIVFEKLPGQRPPLTEWTFHDLTVHPMGADTSEVRLKWLVNDTVIILDDTGDTGKGTDRTFGYALSIVSKGRDGNDTKIYFDPQLVNEGGTGGKKKK